MVSKTISNVIETLKRTELLKENEILVFLLENLNFLYFKAKKVKNL